MLDYQKKYPYLKSFHSSKKLYHTSNTTNCETFTSIYIFIQAQLRTAEKKMFSIKKYSSSNEKINKRKLNLNIDDLRLIRERIDNKMKMKKLKTYNMRVKELKNFKSIIKLKVIKNDTVKKVQNKVSTKFPKTKTIPKLIYGSKYSMKTDTETKNIEKNFFLTDFNSKNSFGDAISNDNDKFNVPLTEEKDLLDLTDIRILKKELYPKYKKIKLGSDSLLINKLFKEDSGLKGKLNEVII